VRTNVSPASNIKSIEEGPDLLTALLQFSQVYPDISLDLKNYLVTGSNAEKATTALQSFAWLVERVANAWGNWIEPQNNFNKQPGFKFIIKEEAKKEKDKELLKIVVKSVPNQIGSSDSLQLPVIDIEGYRRQGDQTGFTYTNEKTKEGLTKVDSKKISQRIVAFDYHDILAMENAWAGISVIRNQDLTNQLTNPDFVYQTPLVRFVNILTPLLDTDVMIDIAEFTLQNPPPENKTPKTLYEHLSTLFKVFFKDIGNESNRIIKISCDYSYSMTDSDLRITLPLALVIPYEFKIPQDWQKDEKAFVEVFIQHILSWFNSDKLDKNNQTGRLIFDLSVFSSISADSKIPVLRLRNLILNTGDIIE